ncbi:MAG: DUF2252 domain-containing protein [Microbacteriaceae bacterium]
MDDQADPMHPPRPVRSADISRALGEAKRSALPPSYLAQFEAKTLSNRDPIELIEEQNLSRVPELIPLRRERMLLNPFAFYRGTAGLQAFDLAQQMDTILPVVICGDAHLGNFGLYSSPERTLVFDLNDFDEADTGAWEWDLYRLVTSVVIGAQQIGFEDEQIRFAARRTVQRYRTWLQKLMDADSIDRYYFRVDEDYIRESLLHSSLEYFEGVVDKASRRTGNQAVDKLLVEDENGSYQFIEDPPILTPLPELTEQNLEQVFNSYLDTVSPDIRMLLLPYQLTDMARRVVGVGSVGTRCFVLALTGPDGGRIILQIKQAQQSVISQYSTEHPNTPRIIPRDASQGERVISYQRILQAVSDPFLGHMEDSGRHYYVRQFRDKKASFRIETMTNTQFLNYISGCAMMLARSHSQSPNAYAISSYLGADDAVDRAVTEWSLEYAKQSRRDFDRYFERYG